MYNKVFLTLVDKCWISKIFKQFVIEKNVTEMEIFFINNFSFLFIFFSKLKQYKIEEVINS